MGHLGQVLEGSQEALAQGSGPFLQAPSRVLQCLVEWLALLQPIKLPRLVPGLVVLAGLAVSVASVVLVA